MKKILKILFFACLPFLFITCSTDSTDPIDTDPDPINLGEILWTFHAGEGLSTRCNPAIASDGTIYIGEQGSSSAPRVCAVNPDGSLKWKSEALDAIDNISIGQDGTIYIDSWTKVIAINPVDGTTKWSMSPHAIDTGYLTLGNDGTIFVATTGTGAYKRALIAISPEGAIKWIKDPAGYGSPTAYHPTIGNDGTLFTYWPVWSESLGRYVRFVQALDPQSGQQIWSTEEFPDANEPRGMAISEDGNIILSLDIGTASEPNKLIKIDALTGSILWNKEAITGAPSIAPNGDILLYGFNAGSYCYNSSGDELWHAENGTSGIHQIAIDSEGKTYTTGGNETLYDGNFQCFDSDGNLAWAIYLNLGDNYCPAIANDGTIYVIGSNDLLYAIQGDKPLASSGWPRTNYNNSNSRNSNF